MVDVEVWTLDLTRLPSLDALSADERERAARLKLPQIRRRFIASRVGLREILAGIIGTDAAALKFGAGENGKPYLLGISNAPHFNLSHSEDVALVAVAAGPVGVDIEQVRPLPSMTQMIGMAFTDAERAALDSLDEPSRLAAFFRLWTRKEAVTKADGRGFKMIRTFSLPLDIQPSPLTPLPQGEGDLSPRLLPFSVCDVQMAEGFVAAVAVLNSTSAGINVRMM